MDLERPSDEALARQAQEGDLSCFEELVHRHEGRVYGFLFNCVRHETDARDLAQATFVTAYMKLGQFDPERSFVTWLFTIARRKWIDRKRAWRDPVATTVPETVDTDDPSSLLARREDGEELWGCARRVLPELQFQALWLKYAEEMGVRDIAKVLRRTQTHVKVLLFRARATLGRELESADAGRAVSPEAAGSATWTPVPGRRAAPSRAPLERTNLGFGR